MVMNLLRKRKNLKRIMWAIAILIVPAFLLWGAGGAIRGKDDIRFAGTIFGRKVSLRDYTQALHACRNQAVLLYGDNFPQVVEYLNLEDQAWNRLILLQQAKREGILVKNDEVINWIKTSPLFQQDERFSQERYNLLLQYLLRIQPRKFEEELRDSLKIAKLQGTIVKEISATDSEVKEAYRQENEKREISYVVIKSENFKEEITVTEEELRNYYKDRREEFRQPPRINVEYLNLAFDKFKGQLSIDDEDIEDYYSAHLEEFILPPEKTKEENKEPAYKSLSEVKGHIRSGLNLQEAKQLAQIKASQIIEELLDQPDLEKVSRKDTVSFGETGFFAAGELIPGVGFSYQFTKEAFNLPKDEISDIITTPQGLYIIRLKEKKPSYIPSFKEGKEEIEKAVGRLKMKERAGERAEELLLKIKDSGFEGAVKELSLTIEKSEPLNRKAYIPGIGEAPQFSRAVFNLKTGEISEAIPTPKGYAIFRLDNIEKIDEHKFAQEKEEFQKALLGQKKERHFQIWFLRLKKEANLKSNIPKPQ